MTTTSYRKKHLSAPLKFLLVLLLLMSCLLTSCGKGGTDTITADTDPEDIKGEEITADQWKAAFDLSSLTNFSMKTSLTTEYGSSISYTVLFSEDLILIKIKPIDASEELEYYCLVKDEDGSYARYEATYHDSYLSQPDWCQYGEHWSRDEIFIQVLMSEAMGYAPQLVLADFLTFDMVTYDQKQKCYYLASSDDSDEIKSFHCKIINGIVAYYEIEIGSDDWGVETPIEEAILYDIGTTTVEKPAGLPQ
ncbi:MAG: hypothetical protein ACI3XE_05915 [Eubacteriales bacterium]